VRAVIGLATRLAWFSMKRGCAGGRIALLVTGRRESAEE
jgi:hypothetical protein